LDFGFWTLDFGLWILDWATFGLAVRENRAFLKADEGGLKILLSDPPKSA
jgi:hypothetical protein